MVFDKKYFFLNKFIEEFVFIFNGNKWGYNGLYLVLRVVERLNGSKIVMEEFIILFSMGFYFVDWFRIGSFF